MSRLSSLNRTVRHSLAGKLVAYTVLGEIVFAVTLGVITGTYVAIDENRHREAQLQQTASALAASLFPTIMDKGTASVKLQLESIRDLGTDTRIECIRLSDGLGRTVAEAGGGPDCCEVMERKGFLSRFTEPHLVTAPLLVGDVEVGSVSIQFAPVGLVEGLAPALLISLLVMASVTLVSVPWVVWLVVRLVIEPVAGVKDMASRLSHGERDLGFTGGRADELGELMRSLGELAVQLGERESKLAKALEDAEKAYRAAEAAKVELERLYTMKSDFVAVASHELRTPLAVIRLYGDLLAERGVGAGDKDVENIVAGLRSSAMRLTSITADLLDAAMLERGIMPIVRERMDGCRLVREACEDAARIASQRDVAVVHEGCDGGLPVFGDMLRLRQVLDNVIGNAVKYAPPGTSVVVTCKAESDVAVIEVADRGPGIKQDRSDRLFTLFGRLDSEDNRQTAGLGLGLAISTRIMEAHGGTIAWRDNPAGSGTVFSVRLPLSDEDRGPERTLVTVIERGGAHRERQA